VSAAPQALLTTIRSRCQHLRMGALPAAELAQYLQGQLGVDADEARLRAALSGGSLGKALTFASDGYRELRGEVIALLEAAPSASTLERLETADRLGEREDLPQALGVMRSVLRDCAALRAGVQAQSLFNADEAPRLGKLAGTSVGERSVSLLEAVAEIQLALRGNASKVLALDVLVDTLHAPR
jgi:DNA polymerase-3 subunit delta'